MFPYKIVKSQYFILLITLQLLSQSNCTGDVSNIANQQNSNPLSEEMKTESGKNARVERNVKTKIDQLSKPSQYFSQNQSQDRSVYNKPDQSDDNENYSEITYFNSPDTTLPTLCDARSKCFREDECSRPPPPCPPPKSKPVVCSEVKLPVNIKNPVVCQNVTEPVKCQPVEIIQPVQCKDVNLNSGQTVKCSSLPEKIDCFVKGPASSHQDPIDCNIRGPSAGQIPITCLIAGNAQSSNPINCNVVSSQTSVNCNLPNQFQCNVNSFSSGVVFPEVTCKNIKPPKCKCECNYPTIPRIEGKCYKVKDRDCYEFEFDESKCKIHPDVMTFSSECITPKKIFVKKEGSKIIDFDYVNQLITIHQEPRHTHFGEYPDCQQNEDECQPDHRFAQINSQNKHHEDDQNGEDSYSKYNNNYHSDRISEQNPYDEYMNDQGGCRIGFKKKCTHKKLTCYYACRSSQCLNNSPFMNKESIWQ